MRPLKENDKHQGKTSPLMTRLYRHVPFLFYCAQRSFLKAKKMYTVRQEIHAHYLKNIELQISAQHLPIQRMSKNQTELTIITTRAVSSYTLVVDTEKIETEIGHTHCLLAIITAHIQKGRFHAKSYLQVALVRSAFFKHVSTVVHFNPETLIANGRRMHFWLKIS